MEDPTYTLGHSSQELEHLSAQERFIGPATRQFFRDAGIGAGMRVLDIGSGGETARDVTNRREMSTTLRLQSLTRSGRVGVPSGK